MGRRLFKRGNALERFPVSSSIKRDTNSASERDACTPSLIRLQRFGTEDSEAELTVVTMGYSRFWWCLHAMLLPQNVQWMVLFWGDAREDEVSPGPPVFWGGATRQTGNGFWNGATAIQRRRLGNPRRQRIETQLTNPRILSRPGPASRWGTLALADHGMTSDQAGRAIRRLPNSSRSYSSHGKNKEVVVSPVCPTLVVCSGYYRMPLIPYCWNNLSDVGQYNSCWQLTLQMRMLTSWSQTITLISSLCGVLWFLQCMEFLVPVVSLST